MHSLIIAGALAVLAVSSLPAAAPVLSPDANGSASRHALKATPAAGVQTSTQGTTSNPAADDRRNRLTPDTDTHVTLRDFATRAEWEAHRDQVRARILRAAGLDPMPERTPLNVSRRGKLVRDGYTVETVVLETWPGFFLAGNLFVPTATPGPHPAVVSPHGHWTYGRFEHSALASVPARAQQLARQGHVVFTYDMVGYGDTTQVPHGFTGPREQLWSFGPLGLQLWNSLRVVDFLVSLPDVDATRIGATGASGGATQVFLLAAVDERIAYAAPVNMVSAYMQGGSLCENAPGLRHGISNLDIAAAIAPRPMLIVSATGDWTSHAPTEEVPAIRRIYALYDAVDALSDQQFDAPHNYHQGSREAVYRFMNAQAFGRTAPVEERGVRVEALADVQAWHGVARPATALGLDDLFASWRDAARRQADATDDVDVLRRRLAAVTEAVWPERVEHDERTGVLRRHAGAENIRARYRHGSGIPLLAVHEDGLEAGRAMPEVDAAMRAGRPVLVIEAFQTGASRVPRNRDAQHFLTFNLSDDQARVQDVVTAIRWLSEAAARRGREAGTVEVTAAGHARYWAALAAVVAPRGAVVLTQGLDGLAGDDETLARAAFVPGLQRVGGIGAVARVLAQGGGR